MAFVTNRRDGEGQLDQCGLDQVMFTAGTTSGGRS